MIYIKSPLYFTAVFVLAAVASLLFPTVQAQGQGPCTVDIVKEAIPSEGTLFDFTCTGGTGGNCGNSSFSLMDGESDTINLTAIVPLQDTATVVEQVPEGWELDDISCETDTPNNISFDLNTAPNGVFITCFEGSTEGTCTFRNIRPIRPIPTLSEWGLIAMAGVLGIIGLLALRRRKAEA